jgi:antitoxin (DNA-binding transcriptional repressor) of toxin-antitoxin stability system
MEVPITQFRREMFALVNRALDGETISVVHKGRRFRIVPEVDPSTRFDRLTPLQIINPNYPDLDDADLKAEILAEMESDWAEI